MREDSKETEHWCNDTNKVEHKYSDKKCPSAYMVLESVMLGHLQLRRTSDSEISLRKL